MDNRNIKEECNLKTIKQLKCNRIGHFFGIKLQVLPDALKIK